MQENLERFLGRGPYPFSLAETRDVMHVGQSSSILILVNKQNMTLSPDQGSHAHSSYEFVIPLTPMPPVGIEKKTVPAELNRLMPINPEQFHGPRGYSTSIRLMGIHADANLVQDIARSTYGIGTVSFQNRFVSPGNRLIYAATSLVEECRSRQSGFQFILDSLSTQITVNLLRVLIDNAADRTPAPAAVHPPGIRRAVEFLHECYDREYSLQELADIANLSPYHFIRVFKAQTGKTPYKYLMEVKINRAKDMLASTASRSITDVCFACGFNNLNHFSTVFKRKVGVTPTEFRKLMLCK